MIDSTTSLTLALISDIVDGPDEERRLTDVLRSVRSLGAQLKNSRLASA